LASTSRACGRHQRGADRGIAEHPGQSDLTQGHAARLGDFAAKPLDHADVRLEIVAAEDGWPNATPPPRQSRDGSPNVVAVVKAPVRSP